MSNVISQLRNTTDSSKLYKLRRFFASDYFYALIVLYSVAVICFNWIIPGAFLLAVITGFVFILSDDIVSVFLPGHTRCVGSVFCARLRSAGCFLCHFSFLSA